MAAMALSEILLRAAGYGRMAGGRPFGALGRFLCRVFSGGRESAGMRERQEMAALIITVFFAVNVLALAADIKERAGAEDPAEGIAREEAGEGPRDVVLTAEGPGIKEDIEYEVGDRKLTDNEIEKLLDRAGSEAEAALPGKNADLSHVTEDLVLKRSAAGGNVRITWDVWDTEFMDPYGKIDDNADIPSDGAEIHLTATFTAFGHKRTVEFTAVVFPEDRELTFREKLLKEMKRYDELSSADDAMELPEKVDGVPVSWSVKGEGKGKLIFITGLTAIALIPLMLQEKKRKKDKRKTEELREDYPGFAHELILYLDCGMSIENAASLIAKDMERTGRSGHLLYAGLTSCLKEIGNGAAADKTWEEFGRKCGLREYIRIGAFMAQFIKTGAGNFRETLEDTAAEAAAMKNDSIRRKSETAGTRLLGPLMMLLAVVMAAVIFPALYSMNM